MYVSILTKGVILAGLEIIFVNLNCFEICYSVDFLYRCLNINNVRKESLGLER